MTSLKPVEPGDLVDAVIKLREALAAVDDSAFALNVSFAALSHDIEAEAAKARHTLQLGAARLVALLHAIEKHPTYQRAKGAP